MENSETDYSNEQYDYIVIGSGFGGSVSAMRLSQKGYKVLVVEQGKRWQAKDFPQSNWENKKYYWYPHLNWQGLFNMKLLNHVLVLRGIGYGGGSLVYGNTLFVPNNAFFKEPIIASLGGHSKLLPYYELAKKMMGATENPKLFSSDEFFKNTALKHYKDAYFMPSPNGIYFGDDSKIDKDPYFANEGPIRSACRFCGGCFLGCRYNAKNTLDKNYLFFAEKFGAIVLTEAKVLTIKPLSANGETGYLLDIQLINKKPMKNIVVKTKGVVLAAGVIGTLELLLYSREQGYLKNVSSQLGKQVRTNNENIVGVRARDGKANFDQGVAASSSVFFGNHTQIQLNHYPAGSDATASLTTLMTDGKNRFLRIFCLLINCLFHPLDFIRTVIPKGFAKNTMLLVVMQNLQSSLSVKLGRRWFCPFKKQLISFTENSNKSPAYIPIANEFAKHLAKEINGIPLNSLPEVLLDIPVTSHILGGCLMAENQHTGVVDTKNQLFGYDNFYVCDGSIIPANLGVNPSLSILALTEHAMSYIPSKEKQKLQLLEIDKTWGIEYLLQQKD